MYIFNTTFLVSDRLYGVWYKWLQEEHIPFMLDSGFFKNPQLAKVLLVEPSDGTSFSLQFHVEDMDTLHTWNEKNEEHFAHQVKNKFGEEVLFFSTVMEVIK